MTQEELTQASELIEAGDKAAAMKMLAPIVEAEPHNMQGWALLAKACTTKPQRIAVLEECLKHNPGNARVETALDKLRPPAIDLFDFQEEDEEGRWYFHPAIKVLTYFFLNPIWVLIVFMDKKSPPDIKIIASVFLVFYVLSCGTTCLLIALGPTIDEIFNSIAVGL